MKKKTTKSSLQTICDYLYNKIALTLESSRLYYITKYSIPAAQTLLRNGTYYEVCVFTLSLRSSAAFVIACGMFRDVLESYSMVSVGSITLPRVMSSQRQTRS